jgi:glycerophosphoryl diester phosphodiesterase
VSDNPLLDPGARFVIGHRGAAGVAPENTLESFDQAVQQGAQALELDVRVTRDGVAVVLHDPTLDRTTDGGGPVAQKTLAEVVAADAGARFTAADGTAPYRGRGIRIPTLRQVLERFPEVPLLVEAKVASAREPIRAELVRCGAERRVVVASFLDSAVGPFRQPPFHAGASRADIVSLVVRSWLRLGKPHPSWPVCYAVPYRYKDLIEVPTRRFIRAARAAGRPVDVWTVDDTALARCLWSRGASGMITNYPALLVAERNRST